LGQAFPLSKETILLQLGTRIPFKQSNDSIQSDYLLYGTPQVLQLGTGIPFK
jgi:hypothetical protein